MTSFYTPINEWKLSSEDRKVLNQYKKIALYSVHTLHVPKKFYDALLFSICLSIRHLFQEGIPFMGKTIKRI